MTHKEHKKLVKRLKVTLILVVLSALCIGVRFLLAPKVDESVAAINELTALDSQVSATQKELNKLLDTIDGKGKEFVSLLEYKDAYVDALGKLCTANALNIHKMTTGDVVIEDGNIASLGVVLELQGDLGQIRDLVNDIYDSRMVCRINSISYRLEGETFSWMWRAIDENDMVSWWDISSVTEYLLTDPDYVAGQDEKDVLDANAFMQHGTALCYLDVQFVGNGG